MALEGAKELTKLGGLVDRDDPELIPVHEEGLPAEDWPLERLAWYATRAEERARRCGGMESVQRFRLGQAIHFAHPKVPRGQWKPWVDRTFTFTRMTAWRAEQLYLRAVAKYGERAEEACASYSVTALYVLLGLKKKDEWLTDEEEGQPPEARRRARSTKRARPPAPNPPARPGSPAPKEGGDGPVEPDESDDADEPGDDADQPRDNFPSDPRRYAEGRWQKEYAAHQLARIAADSLRDAVARFVPGDGQALRAVLEEVQEHARRLSRRCEEVGG
jgi:hypothetical protein